MPIFPAPDSRSEQEKFIKLHNFDFGQMENDKVLQEIWNKKIFHFCNDFETIEDLKEAISAPESYEDITGALMLKEHTSKVVNTRNGNRITTNQPSKYKRAIFLVGKCTTFGIGADDEHTIASYLQRKLNKLLPDEEFTVYNCGRFIGNAVGLNITPIIKELPIRENDIVLIQDLPPLYGLPFCDLVLKAKRPHKYRDIFLDGVHYTANGNKLIADGMFDFLKQHNFFKNTKMKVIDHNAPKETKTNSDNTENELLRNYKAKLKTFYDENIRPKVGAIVMNANPFTFGHRYLVETALKSCDYLIVFVVEEDKSEIPFKDRFALVKENTADLSNVFVMPSGEFIISARTFSDYFRKESIQEQKIDTSKDVNLFAKEIAPTLDISVRFAGEEPTDKITAQYNEDMAKILPQYGLEFIEIERCKTKTGDIVSASTVRKLAKARDFEKLKTLVPPATLRYLREKY